METGVVIRSRGMCYHSAKREEPEAQERNGMAGICESLLARRRKRLEQEKSRLGAQVREEVSSVLQTMISSGEVRHLSDRDLQAIQAEVEDELRGQQEDVIADELDILSRLEQNL